jgi:DNA-binding response OmpR family regulator
VVIGGLDSEVSWWSDSTIYAIITSLSCPFQEQTQLKPADTILPQNYDMLQRMSHRILVVDDEPSVTDLIAYNLRKALYDVQVAADGRAALRLARELQPDLILLDLMIPEVDGLDVCRELRKSSDVPIIMITARGEELDRVLGLEIGADDYVTKPFSVRELMARIKAVLRRAPRGQQAQKVGEAEPSTLLSGPGNLLMDVERRSVVVDNICIELTRLEFDLLHRLLINPGRVLTRERLLEQAWGYDYVGDTRAVDSAVKRLRAKLRAISTEADCIESVRGLGYRVS